MKKLVWIAIVFLVAGVSCNNPAENKSVVTKSRTDSLLDDVLAGHDEGMAKSNRIATAQKLLQQKNDSLNKLGVKQKAGAAGYKIQLDSLDAQLRHAAAAMDQWMQDFSMDSARNDETLRAKYLESEKERINTIKEKMIAALQKADTLLKK